MTAHHVAAEALACAEPRLAYGAESTLHGAPIVAHEFFPELDLALLRARVPIARTARWRVGELAMLEDVFASGYPYALDETRAFFSIRALKGYVVSRVNFTPPAGQPALLRTFISGTPRALRSPTMDVRSRGQGGGRRYRQPVNRNAGLYLT